MIKVFAWKGVKFKVMSAVRDVEQVKRIKLLYIRPNEIPREIIVPDTQRTIKDLVGNPMKTIYLDSATKGAKDKVILLYNENKDKGLVSANRYLSHYGIIYGNFVIALENKNGYYKSLTNELITKYSELFGSESIKETEKHIKSLIRSRVILREQLRR